jgi:energy-coupling factor transporter ATP-binding protein EcfA2
MSGSYRRTPESTARPPSYTTEIPVTRTSKLESSKGVTRPRGSLSTGASRDVPRTFVEPSHKLSPDQQVTKHENTQLRVCESCEVAKSPVWTCSYCDMNFCDDCWDKQGPHKAGRTGPDGLPHEKANPAIVKRLQEILTPPQEHSEQQILHIEDEDTTWFGMERNSQNSPVFHDYGRYSAIMADSNSGEFKFRYPQLVSFIGQTGAGKSTLIKMLIDQQERINTPRDWSLPSPVAGTSANGNVPTSGDVHLYSDPSTYYTEYPMLYADCEGLEGGENIPIAAQYRNGVIAPQKEKGRDFYALKEHRKRRKVSKSFHSTQRDIQWANSPEKSKRQYAVTELYPRLLYTFSDVIVFVLRNAK